MITLKFKTNINCNHCIAKVTPYLNEEPLISEWNVDTLHPDKVMTVSGESINPEIVKNALKKAGYSADIITE